MPTLDGAIAQTLKRCIQSGEAVRIPGKGMPNLRGGRHGDLLVQLIVETPKHLTKRQEELLRELAEIDQKHVPPQRKSFLEKLKEFFAPEEPRPASGGRKPAECISCRAIQFLIGRLTPPRSPG